MMAVHTTLPTTTAQAAATVFGNWLVNPEARLAKSKSTDMR